MRISVAALGGKVLLWAFTTSEQSHRYSHLSDNTLLNPDPSGVPEAQRSPQGENTKDPPVSQVHRVLPVLSSFRAATPQTLHGPNLCGELVYKKRSAGFPNKPPSPQHISSHT